MFLEYQKVRTKHYYKIGYCSEWEKYLLVITVPYVSYFDQYYVIEKDEYNLWKNNVDKLDAIAEECRKDNIYCKRFLYSEMPRENTEEQLEILFGDVAKRKCNPDFERI
ncbi:MAG: hypothetical protein J1E83_08775 [Lachnospiraceae bacterium]|nr:hypothetical protein [Lachnospiraceae bacterium]